LSLKEEQMTDTTGTGKAKVQSEALEGEKDFRHETESREEQRRTDEQIEQQDLNQGMDTGTHSSAHLGVNWGSAYRLRPEAESAAPQSKRVEARAYELYLQRGGEHGHDVEDWLAAEKELQE
jgi:hypothetical protein